ncbi:outer membrane beta-barrel protein [Flavihumibacter sp. ZG627]|uniref:outer membrane beta-barrel protein n=1 Tax=Flavihumibacter sp. ZG627 TaxID=1463156 RepID=UPI00057C8457|nr:outer membrane beta-barrel protein [Flavihumibacter sp. ZG627]KIC91192.1 hypothetical protein HY58_09345 [Flavihumibacter sp. ZG627]
MKKTMIVMMAIGAIAFQANAQDSKLYIKGGYNLANISVTKDGGIEESNALSSFHAGFMADLPVGEGALSFQPGLLFSGKGAKWQSGSETDQNYIKATTSPKYIEIPLNLVVNIPLVDKESKFFVGGGGYAAMGIAGKNKTEGKFIGVAFESEDKIEFSNDDPTTTGTEENGGLGMMKRFDLGLNGTAGFAFKNVMVSVNYGHGLTKINSGGNNSSDDKNKNRVWSLSLGLSL